MICVFISIIAILFAYGKQSIFALIIASVLGICVFFEIRAEENIGGAITVIGYILAVIVLGASLVRWGYIAFA